MLVSWRGSDGWWVRNVVAKNNDYGFETQPSKSGDDLFFGQTSSHLNKKFADKIWFGLETWFGRCGTAHEACQEQEIPSGTYQLPGVQLVWIQSFSSPIPVAITNSNQSLALLTGDVEYADCISAEG